MSINKGCFDDAMVIVLDILNKYDISDRQERIDKIIKIYNKMINDEEIDREFYSLAHEIKGYDFIRSFGEALLANDKEHEAGPDINFRKNRIECVCCSEGNILDAGYKEYSINHNRQKCKIIDYNKTKEYLLPRITNSLYYKKDEKIVDYIKRNIIKSDECPIIFISLGQMNIDFNSGVYGSEILEVLIGRGSLSYVFDMEKNKFIYAYWQKNETIKKNKGTELVDIPAIFFNNNNVYISGILFSTANIYEEYNVDNTFLFLNPYAKNVIDENEFKDIIYWKCKENNEYIPMKNNKDLSDNLKPNIF